MTPKGIGFALLFVAALCAFIAWERYDTNAENLRAIQSSPLAKGFLEAFGGTQAARPAVPTESKYAMFIGAAALIGGIVLVLPRGSGSSDERSARPRRTLGR